MSWYKVGVPAQPMGATEVVATAAFVVAAFVVVVVVGGLVVWASCGPGGPCWVFGKEHLPMSALSNCRGEFRLRILSRRHKSKDIVWLTWIYHS